MADPKLILAVFTSFILAAPTGQAGLGSVNRTTSQAIAKQLSNRLIKPRLKIKNSSGRTLSMVGSKKFQAFLLQDGTIRVWDLDVGVQRPRIQNVGANFTAIALDSVNERILAGYENGLITVTDILTSKPVFSLDPKIQSAVVDMKVSTSGVLLASFENGVVMAWELNSKKEKWRISLNDSIQKLSIDDRYWVGVVNDTQIEARNLQDGKLVYSVAPVDEKVSFLDIGKNTGIVTAGYVTGDVLTFDLITGKTIAQKKAGDDNTIMKPGGQGLLAYYSADTEKLLVIDENKGTEVKMNLGDKEAVHIGFTDRGNQLFAIDQEGGIYLFDVITGKKLLRLVSTRQGWTVLDGVGRFDTSEPGLPNVSWDADGNEIPLDKFSERYYEPGLLASVVSGKSDFINKKPPVVEEGIYLPPKLKLAFDESNAEDGKPSALSVEVFDQGGEIDQIRVFHNGKALSMDSAVIKPQNKNDKLLEMEILPVAGSNLLEVVAIDKRGVESEAVDMKFQVQGQATDDSTLHVVTIGINQYADSRLDLDYSVADAEYVAKLLRENKLAHFNKVEDRMVYNRSATKSEILRAIREAGQSSQNDVLTIYMAGHGLVVDNEWYFLPHETLLQPDQAYYAKVGISAQQIKDLLIDSKAQKILLMVDSCYSGAGISAFSSLMNTQRHMGRSLSRSVGITVLTATRKNQEAAELSDLGHGLFTYAVTRGMGGNADRNPRNQKISAYELVDFTKSEIPQLTRKYQGASQEPDAFQMGKDFNLLAN